MIRAMVEQEGRTVFLSSHLLDEVEKICDAARSSTGQVVTQGPIEEISRGGAGAANELILGVDDVYTALGILDGSELVREAHRSDEGIRVALAGEPQSAARERGARARWRGGASPGPVRHSLEQRFLEITARLDEPPSSATRPRGRCPRDRDRAAPGRG